MVAGCCPHCGQKLCAEVCRQRRFQVGSRVLAKIGDDEGGWRPGTISQVDYRDDDWRPDRAPSPYQILLDSPCRFENLYVHAPEDHDSVVRTIPENAQDIPHWNCDKRKCCDAGEKCPFHHVCDDKFNCPKYHFCGKEGRRKTRLLKKLAERAHQENTDSTRCRSCQEGVCEDFNDASIDTLLEFVEGQHTQNGARRARKIQFGAGQIKKGTKKRACKKEEPGAPVGCECDCHAIAASGRKAVIEMLREGVDFSSVFTEDLFETADMDSDDQAELAAFKWRTLAEEDMSMQQYAGLC